MSILTVTKKAADKIKELAGDSANQALRVDVVGGAASGFAYDIFFDDPQPDDIVVEVDGVTILVHPDSQTYLTGSTIDWVEGANGAGLLISNPNEPEK